MLTRDRHRQIQHRLSRSAEPLLTRITVWVRELLPAPLANLDIQALDFLVQRR
jgi:hypothetical protein